VTALESDQTLIVPLRQLLLHTCCPPMASSHVHSRRVVDAQVVSIPWYQDGQVPKCVLQLIQYDLIGFTLMHFTNAEIDCPNVIANAVRQRQAEFFFGRACARIAVEQSGFQSVSIGIGSRREPLWPAGLMGSISHSKKFAAALVLPANDYAGVGIDIEQVVDETAAVALRSLATSEKELAYLATWYDRLDRYCLLTLVFSAKESFFKATYQVVQRYFDFDVLELETLDLRGAYLEFRLAQTLCTEWQRGDRCRIAIALLGDDHVATLFVWPRSMHEHVVPTLR
jgi:enterobactin synthetase component D